MRMNLFFASLLASAATIAVAGAPSSDGNLIETGSLNHARYGQSATLLPDGRVLMIAGGATSATGASIFVQSAEIYDPATGGFTQAGTTSMLHVYHGVATVALNDGSVLICGGEVDLGNGRITGSALAERYDPVTGSFSTESSMVHARTTFTATRLQDGRVLVAGGGAPVSDPAAVPTRKAEIYDPATRRFAEIGEAAVYRNNHSATLLNDGRVLVAGGECATRTGENNDLDYCASAELYDPATGTFTPTGTMAAPRYGHRTAVLADGRVLFSGGYENHMDEDMRPASTAEIYDPATGQFRKTTGASPSARAYHTATTLPNGEVLLAGGYTGNSSSPITTMLEVYDPQSDGFRMVGELLPEVGGVLFPSATLLRDGRVLIAGGLYFPYPGSFYPGAVKKAFLYESPRPDRIFDDGFEAAAAQP